jgi:raffinose/stachyose/melibiose transport system permease protein
MAQTEGQVKLPSLVARRGGLLSFVRRQFRDGLKVWHLYLFLLPTFIFLIVFQYYPALSALYHAFTKWNGAGISEWIGLANFENMLTDRILHNSVKNMLIIVAWTVFRSIFFPLVVAEMIYSLRSQVAQYVFRLLFIIPIIVPFIVVMLVWRSILAPQPLGVVNAVLDTVGLTHLQQPWLGDPHIALRSVLFVGFPWVGAVGLLIFYAGLINIPEPLNDAVKIDGGTTLQRIRFLDLPLIMGQVKVVFILSLINAIQEFAGILILTNGGPAFSTTVPALHMYKTAFQGDRFGYASAIGLVMFVLILGITYINMRYIRSDVEYEP